MKKIARALLIPLIINLLGSFAYAGPGDVPRPNSDDPTTMTVEVVD